MAATLASTARRSKGAVIVDWPIFLPGIVGLSIVSVAVRALSCEDAAARASPPKDKAS